MEILGYPNGAISALAARLTDCPARLRWGGDKVPNAINGGVSLLNGLQQLQAFAKAHVPTITYTNLPAIRDEWAAECLVLGRKLNHTQGMDIVVPGTLRRNLRWQRRDYWTIYEGREVVRELRVHIFRNRAGKLLSIARGVKSQCLHTSITASTTLCPDCGYDLRRRGTGDGVTIRSRRNGWIIRHDTSAAINDAARRVAKAAVAAVGYDLGAVDMLDKGGDRYVVLEVNSRPAIRDPYTLTAYADAIRRWATPTTTAAGEA